MRHCKVNILNWMLKSTYLTSHARQSSESNEPRVLRTDCETFEAIATSVGAPHMRLFKYGDFSESENVYTVTT
jgi:hypothetical protein